MEVGAHLAHMEAAADSAVEAVKRDIDPAATQVPRMEEHHAQVQVPRAPAVTLMLVQVGNHLFSLKSTDSK